MYFLGLSDCGGVKTTEVNADLHGSIVLWSKDSVGFPLRLRSFYDACIQLCLGVLLQNLT